MRPDLLVRSAEVSDGRCDQSRVHPLAVVLALCAAAVVTGMSSFTAIAGWAADVPAGQQRHYRMSHRAEVLHGYALWSVKSDVRAALRARSELDRPPGDLIF
jgi:DDE family transposase